MECERLPLSELSLFECKNGNEQDNSIVDLISGQERSVAVYYLNLLLILLLFIS